MNQEDKDQIVSQLKALAEKSREQWRDIESSPSADQKMGYTLLTQSITYSKIADIFQSLRTE